MQNLYPSFWAGVRLSWSRGAGLAVDVLPVDGDEFAVLLTFERFMAAYLCSDARTVGRVRHIGPSFIFASHFLAISRGFFKYVRSTIP